MGIPRPSTRVSRKACADAFGAGCARRHRSGNLTEVSLDRASLASQIERVLNVGNTRNPDVYLVEAAGRKLVVKDFAPRGPIVRHTLGRWITRREMEIYRTLSQHPAVPALVAEIDALAFAIEYRPGRRMSRSLAGDIPSDFLTELEKAVDAMHARGIVHLDLRHRSNIMVDDAGYPVLIDFGSALRFRPGGLPARWVLPILAWLDRRALTKWRVRLFPQPPPDSALPPASATGAASEGKRGAKRPM